MTYNPWWQGMRTWLSYLMTYSSWWQGIKVTVVLSDDLQLLMARDQGHGFPIWWPTAPDGKGSRSWLSHLMTYSPWWQGIKDMVVLSDDLQPLMARDQGHGCLIWWPTAPDGKGSRSWLSYLMIYSPWWQGIKVTVIWCFRALTNQTNLSCLVFLHFLPSPEGHLPTSLIVRELGHSHCV